MPGMCGQPPVTCILPQLPEGTSGNPEGEEDLSEIISVLKGGSVLRGQHYAGAHLICPSSPGTVTKQLANLQYVLFP